MVSHLAAIVEFGELCNFSFSTTLQNNNRRKESWKNWNYIFSNIEETTQNAKETKKTRFQLADSLGKWKPEILGFVFVNSCQCSDEKHEQQQRKQRPQPFFRSSHCHYADVFWTLFLLLSLCLKCEKRKLRLWKERGELWERWIQRSEARENEEDH